MTNIFKTASQKDLNETEQKEYKNAFGELFKKFYQLTGSFHEALKRAEEEKERQANG